MTRSIASLGLGLIAMSGCGSPTAPVPKTRSFVLGFTEFPYAGTQAAVDFTYQVIARDADFVNHHFDGGVPWNEALTGRPYPQSLEGDITRAVTQIPTSHRRLVSATAINFLRNGLADYRNESSAQPLPAPWDTASFDNPNVKQAYLAYCRHLIDRLRPDYFAYAIEVNLLAEKSPAKWPSFLRLAEFIHGELKRAYPSLAVFPTLQLELMKDKPAPQAAAVTGLLPWTDIIAVSTYPYAASLGPEAVNRSYYDPVTRLAPSKPFAIAETAWPAEPVTAPYPIDIPSDPARQQAYVERLLATMDEMNAVFIDYFFTRDYDDFWETTFKFSEIAPLVRVWKDTGLYAGDGTVRPALVSWRAVVGRPKR